MIADLLDISDVSPVETDLCIVGAGPAGIALALQMAGQGIDVLMLESGGMKPEPRTQALYEGENCDARLHSPPDRYRQRRFGGTSTIWGGRCMPLDPIDFEARDYIPHSGWPFGIEALESFYPEANRLCEAGRFEYRAAEAFGAPKAMIEGFESAEFTTDSLERFSCPTDFGRRYHAKLAAAMNVRVLLHANVTAIRLHPDGSAVRELEVRDLNGKKIQVRARTFVLAAGGLEIPRLLLANRDVQTTGIGNEFEVVGRYYMCHLAGTIGSIRINAPPSAVHYGYSVSDEGVYCRQRFALRAEAQRRERLGNFVARLHHPRISDPAHGNAVLSTLYLAKALIPYEYGKRLHGGDQVGISAWLRHVGNVIGAPFDAAGFAWHMLKDRKLAARKFPSIIIKPRRNLFSLDFHAEQRPDRSSRVTLAHSTDELGVPRLKIDWRYNEGDVDTVRRSLALLSRSFAASGIGSFDYDPDTVEMEMTRYGAYGGHHIGTARMGTDPRSSVVDADCKVHSVRNLFLAGSAVFPTSSQANPTLSVVALTLRLAEHLKSMRQQLRNARVSRHLVVHGAENFIGARLVASWRNTPDVQVTAVRSGDAARLRPALADAHFAVHCILGKPARIESAGRLFYSLLSSAAHSPRVVHVGSITVYGGATGSVDESSAAVGALGEYAEAQRRVESLASAYKGAVILRAGVEYGPDCDAWSGRVAQWLRSGRLGDLGEYGDGICNLIYVDDLVALIGRALQQANIGGEIFNAAAAEKITWNEYFTGYAIALGAVPVRRIGARRLRLESGLLAPPLMALELLTRPLQLHSPPPISRSLLATCRQEISLLSARAERRLAACWTPLRHGLAQAAACYS